jgi:hypothetical protein
MKTPFRLIVPSFVDVGTPSVQFVATVQSLEVAPVHTVCPPAEIANAKAAQHHPIHLPILHSFPFGTHAAADN